MSMRVAKFQVRYLCERLCLYVCQSPFLRLYRVCKCTVYAYAYAYAYAHVYVYVCIRTNVRARTYVCVYVCVSVCNCVRTYMYTCAVAVLRRSARTPLPIQPQFLPSAMTSTPVKRNAPELSSEEKVPMVDPSDRAAKRMKYGIQRIPLDALGFWPENRGGLGLCSKHVHDIAKDIVQNKTSIQRYQPVLVMEMPPHLTCGKDGFIAANEHRARTDELMPPCAQKPRYMTLSKTHFTHAHKLFKQGGRVLYNDFTDKPVPIVYQDGDVEGKTISEQGPLCQIYDQTLLDDILR